MTTLWRKRESGRDRKREKQTEREGERERKREKEKIVVREHDHDDNKFEQSLLGRILELENSPRELDLSLKLLSNYPPIFVNNEKIEVDCFT